MIGLLFAACQKEDLPSDNLDVPHGSNLHQSEPITKIENQEEAKIAFAEALTKAMHSDNRVLQWINSKSKQQALRNRDGEFQDILLAVNQDNLVYDRNTLAQVLSEHFSEELIREYGNAENIIQTILEFDPLLTIKYPDKFINIPLPENYSPIVTVSNAEGELIYYLNGVQVELPRMEDNQTVMTLVVKTSEKHMLVHSNLEKIYGSNLSLKDRFLQAVECSGVLENIDSKPTFSLLPDYKLINILDDVRDIYIQNCAPANPTLFPPGDPNIDPGDPDDPPNWTPPCPRRDIAHDYNFNSIEGFQLESPGYDGGISTFESIDNQPCNGGEEMFDFIFAWAYILNADSEIQRFNFSVSRNELITPATYEITAWIQPNWFQRWILGIPPIPIYTMTQDAYANYIDIHQPLFANNSNNLIDNNWTESNQGDKVELVIEEWDEVTCSNTETRDFSIDFDFKVKTGVIQAGVEVEYSVKETIKYTAAANHPLSRWSFHYCDGYSNYPNMEYATSGPVKVDLYAPLITH